MTDKILEVRGLTKTYGGEKRKGAKQPTPTLDVLKGIDIDIYRGDVVCLIGPSGCGKTTLLNLILGLTDADSGKIIFDGQDITNVPMEKRGFNIVFQDYALFPNLNVMQNITYGLKNTPNISTQEEVNELIELLGLKPHLDKKIDQLSGGQKQRVAIARALANDPAIILADEPTGNLDTKASYEIMEFFTNLNKEGATVIVVTHEEEIAAYTDRIIRFQDGQIVSDKKVVKGSC